jgi:ADP-heptose:LPS heptosyltransferase
MQLCVEDSKVTEQLDMSLRICSKVRRLRKKGSQPVFLPSLNGPPLKIGIYRTSSIGDVVLATACVDLVSKLKMRAEIVWIGRQPALSLIKEAFPQISCVDIGNNTDLSKNSALIQDLAPVHFLIDLQGNIRSRMVALNFKRLHGKPIFTSSKAQVFRSTLVAEARLFGRSRSLSAKAFKAPEPQFKLMLNALERGLREQLPSEMIDVLNSHQARPFLPTEHDTGQRPWQKELRLGRWLAVAPGASHETKRAPLELFAEIAKIVRSELGDLQGKSSFPFGILIVGDESDRQFGLSLLDALAWQGPSLNLAGRLSLWETALALKEAQILLSNDSGLGHISEAVETPTAVLFGPTVEGFGFSPQLKDSLAFSVNLGCRPCSKHGKSECRFNDKLCFTTIQKKEVAAHVAAAIKRPKPSRQDEHVPWVEAKNEPDADGK